MVSDPDCYLVGVGSNPTAGNIFKNDVWEIVSVLLLQASPQPGLVHNTFLIGRKVRGENPAVDRNVGIKVIQDPDP